MTRRRTSSSGDSRNPNVGTTVRVVTHTPTGDLVIVRQMNFTDDFVVAGRVTATKDLSVTKVVTVTLKRSECSRPSDEPRTRELLERLWESGVRAVARDAGQDVVISTSVRGNNTAKLYRRR
jgi:hypothetical protein